VRLGPVLTAVLTAALVAGCTGQTTPPEREAVESPSAASTADGPTAVESSDEPTDEAGPSETSASPERRRKPWRDRGPELDDWEIGARTLPLRQDGFGQVRRTPRELRVRIMPTITNLPPPRWKGYRADVRRITPWVRGRMGTSWERGCPVGLRRMRYLQVTFWGFDRRRHVGELIVHEDHARGIAQVFRKLYDARFPIEQMTLPTSVERDPTPSGDGNGTGAMACRATVGQTFWSAHALGKAIDINPFQNPYLRDGLVIPERASAYLDRSWRRPGMILRGGVVVRAFRDIGWSWGGDWRTLKDYQHFSATGR
jgi:hypothetical protein